MNFIKSYKFIGISSLLGSLYVFRNRKGILQSKEFPTYTRREVMNHRTKDEKIWITYKDGVYDITDWVSVHPGGEEKIMMGAGGALEPFWEMYDFHKNKDIYDILEKYRVGNLDKKDILDPKDIPNFDSLKKDKITRSELLKVHSRFPFCAESPSDQLVENFYTPESLFFVRNHYGIPDAVDVKKYKVKLFSSVGKEKEINLSLDDLKKKYKKNTIDSIVMCTGNRRSHMSEETGMKAKGLEWHVGAISNGKWSGVLVRDVLRDLGYNENNAKGLHLIATGMDKDFQGKNFNISIPLEVALDKENNVMLAYEYNDSDIPFEHGYPLRLIVPGYVGVRNAKWLKSIEIADHESTHPSHTRDYRIVPKGVDWDKADFSKLAPVYKLVTNSVIVQPKDGESLKDSFKIKGWALGYQGSKLAKIELSFDEGKTWVPVDKVQFHEQGGKVYGWTLWEYDYQGKDKGTKSIWVRAEDSMGNKQPLTSDEIWNVRGLMNNAVHKVKINLI
jgi:sulfite oxidase